MNNINNDPRNISFKRLYILFAILFFIISIIFAFVEIKSWILSVSYFTLAILFLISVSYKLRKIIKVIESYLENLIEEKQINEKDIIYKDDIFSKLIHKICKVNYIHSHTKELVKNEKNKIESLVSDIAHQVKTPMTNIKMYLDLLISKLENQDENREIANIVYSQADKLDFLIQSMLKMSELETGIIVLNLENTIVQKSLMKALENVVLNAEKKNIKINVHEGMLLNIFCDIRWTAEALFNILDNAVKYTPNGGEINISAKKMQVYTLICIKDNGIGIKKNNLTKIFQRFYREKNKGYSEGVGIGLSLSREIIMQQGGYIAVESEKGKGSIFNIFLPKNNSIIGEEKESV